MLMALNWIKHKNTNLKESINDASIQEAKYKAETQQFIRDQQKEVAEYQRLVTANAPQRLPLNLPKLSLIPP